MSANKERPHVSKAERARMQREQQTLNAIRQQEKLSRRRFLQRAVVLGAGLAVAGGAAEHFIQESDKMPTYQGVIDSLRGQTLISQEHFTAITEALSNCKVPLLQKLGNDIRILHSSGVNPGLPSWVNNSSFPVPITNDSVSSASYSASHCVWDQNPDTNFYVQNGEQNLSGKVLDNYAIGIHLATPGSLAKNGSLAEAIYLAKEFIGIMSILRMADEFWDMNEILRRNGQSNFVFTERNNKPVTNRQRQIKIGETIFIDEIYKVNTNTGVYYPNLSDIWKIADGMPLFFAAQAEDDANRKRPFPYPNFGLKNFHVAQHVMSKYPGLSTQVRAMAEKWAASNELLPPRGFSNLAFSQPMFSAIVDLEKKMYLSQK